MANNKIAFKYPAMHKEIAMPINPYLLIKYQVRIMFKKAETAPIKTGVFMSFLAKKLGETGDLTLQISDDQSNAISTARVNFTREEKSIPGYQNDKGIISISLPLGEWKITTKDNGRTKSER